MTASYLYLNAALYLIFGVWMTVSPWKTAASVGYQELSAGGRSEFLTIYGGLQLGLAAFFAMTASVIEFRNAGVLFALCLYVPLVFYRAITVLKYWPVKNNTLMIGALELVLALGAIALSI